jgi:hypothetical protein
MAKSTTVFIPGVMHNHKPSGYWPLVQANPDSENWQIEWICRRGADPAEVMTLAFLAGLVGKPLAKEHLNWFLSTGSGADYVEDKNLEAMLRSDSGVQAKINKAIPKGRTSGIFAAHFAIEQSDYSDDNYSYSFGEIDRLDFEVDFTAKTIHAWFMDRYEWHPVYPFYQLMHGDYKRPTNAVHAAAVELKAGLARDYWMKGEVTIPLDAIQSTASPKMQVQDIDGGLPGLSHPPL